MNVVIWIITGLLAVAMIGAGASKLFQPKDKLIASGQPWAEDFAGNAVKTIGLLEVLGGLGLILPALLDTATVLVPVAATGVALLMAGAVVVHLRRGEKTNAVVPLVLTVIAVVVAVTRFGAYSF